MAEPRGRAIDPATGKAIDPARGSAIDATRGQAFDPAKGDAFDPATGDWLPVGPADGAPPAWDPEAPKTKGVIGWHILLGVDIGILSLLLVGAVITYFIGGEPQPIDGATLLAGAAFIFLLLGVIPFAWVVGTRQGGFHGAIHYLKLERPGHSILQGAVVGGATYLALILLGFLLYSLGIAPDDNPQAEALTGAMTLPIALAVALAAAFGEEIFFRGLLQRWIGMWPQAILFALLHADYGTPWQLAGPFALGLLYGYLIKRGARLWVPITAHFLFNFVQFLLAIYAPVT